ncbi:EEF1A lysine methyltransferase 3 [Phytophthora citrophthora]|uniref:EEF1A lysine methyltransferase 3 n=1 Tax=Phytophthora citrophthora TaxID=4793 RepID=A0AAD9LT86_9STRA|nr:EEF1A lysine methyltransferase 3 [Phytophthora citrophthora]
MSDVEDSGDDELWGRTERREFSYAVAIPGVTDKISLTAVQDRDVCAGTPTFPSHGHCVWDAALLLADYLQTKAQQPTGDGRFTIRGKKVVELGAGVGLVGMMLAVLGAQVTLTDQEYALPLLSKNVAINFVGDGKAANIAASVPAVEECQWGEPFQAGGILTSWKKNTDVVVFSDVLYHASAFLLLIKTLHELVSPTTHVYFSFETRNATIEANFLQELGKTFVVEEVSRKENNQVYANFEYPDELFIYYAHLEG